MPANLEHLEQRILEFLARYPREQFKAKEMARRIGVRTEQNFREFLEVLRRLQDDGKVQRHRGKLYQHLFVSQKLTGTLRLTRQGFGFVSADDSGEEIYIASRDTNDATHGDHVEVALYVQSTKQKEREAKREGEIVRIIERGRTQVVGTLEREKKTHFVIPDDIRVASAITIAKEDLNGAEEGQKVVVEVESWGTGHFHPVGRIVEVLGQAGEARAELLSVAREFNLPATFPQHVTDEAAAISPVITPEEVRRRRDLRSLLCFTIDPVDAKDFDDAVSLEDGPDGTLRLGVHIADVSAYVTEGSALDAEALQRATSVYFPGSVIPMLPERLSGDLCSLRPKIDRLTFSVFMDLTPRGAVQNYEITESVIHSKRRFTYEEVQKIVDGDEAARAAEPPELIERIDRMNALAKVLTSKRMKEGAIDFDSPEAAFTFDQSGYPIGIQKKVRLQAHRLVEEFMLMANKTVARHIGVAKKEQSARPFIYRIHDVPDPQKITELSLFVRTFGYHLEVNGSARSKDLQRLLEQVRGSEVENLINEVTLRSMAKAIYSEKNIGHYGLAFPHYTHFTSPIRRYPDLIVHRLLKEYASGMSAERVNGVRRRLPYLAKHSSEMERNAMEAERAATKVLQVEYMQRHLGDVFTAVVSGVTHFGLFVEIDDLLVEGMVHVRDLDDDYYVYDEKKFSLTGRRNGRQYRLGDAVRVEVVRVNTEERKIDFRIAPEERSSREVSRRPARSQRRGEGS